MKYKTSTVEPCKFIHIKILYLTCGCFLRSNSSPLLEILFQNKHKAVIFIEKIGMGNGMHITMDHVH